MKIGITTPIVTLFPASASPWEHTATVGDLVDIVTAADALGYHHVTCSEHVAIPEEVADIRGGRYWDPLATLSFLTAHTTEIRLLTSVLVLGYHHPLALAKRYGTLDVLSGGRVVLGVGVGSLREEFDLLGAQFDGRGPVADRRLSDLRATLSQRRPDRYPGLVVEPAAVQPKVPVWVGGQSRRSLRRAIELGDGWMPFGHPPAELGRWLEETELPAGFTVLFTADRLDPIDEPETTAARLAELEAAHATHASVSFTARSAAHFAEQLAALAALPHSGV